MAHMLMESDSMFSVREVPWHGLGTIVQEAPSALEAIRIAGLTWQVECHPVHVDGNMVPGYKANVRSDTKKCLGIVSDRYKIVQNMEAFEFTDALLEFDAKFETAGSLEDGKRVWLLARMPETEILGDKTENFLLFANCHDGKGAIRVAATAIRVVCNNTLNLALGTANRAWSTKHMGRMADKMAECARMIDLNNGYMTALKAEAERLSMKKITNTEVKAWIETLFPIDENDVDRAKNNQKKMRDGFLGFYLNAPDLANFRDTAWGFVQAAADFAYHARPIRLTEKYAEAQMGRAIDGHALLDQVYAMVS
jgi:phage/plasmid-like protein (TIGR03299 family)